MQSEGREFTRLSVSLSVLMHMGFLQSPGDGFGIQASRGTCLCSNSFKVTALPDSICHKRKANPLILKYNFVKLYYNATSCFQFNFRIMTWFFFISLLRGKGNGRLIRGVWWSNANLRACTVVALQVFSLARSRSPWLGRSQAKKLWNSALESVEVYCRVWEK